MPGNLSRRKRIVKGPAIGYNKQGHGVYRRRGCTGCPDMEGHGNKQAAEEMRGGLEEVADGKVDQAYPCVGASGGVSVFRYIHRDHSVSV